MASLLHCHSTEIKGCLYAIAIIEQHYIEIKNNIISKRKKQNEIVICGNCQLDSSGWSVTKGTYTFMEYNSKNMINMEFGDKRKVEYWVDIYDVHEKVEISPHIYEHINLVCPLLYRKEKDPLFPPPSGTFFWKFSHKVHQWDQYTNVQWLFLANHKVCISHEFNKNDKKVTTCYIGLLSSKTFVLLVSLL